MCSLVRPADGGRAAAGKGAYGPFDGIPVIVKRGEEAE
jgi:hypothetical protein